MLEELKLIRLYNNGIINKFNDVFSCVEGLHGIQAQYDIYSYISLLNRVNGFNLNDLLKTNVFKSWGQRVTLHINTKTNMDINRNIYSGEQNWIKKYFNTIKVNIDDVFLDIINGTYDETITKESIQNNIKCTNPDILFLWSAIIAQASIDGILYEKINLNNKKHFAFYRRNFISDNISKENFDSSLNLLIIKYIKTYGPVSVKDFMHWSGLGGKKIVNAFYEVADTTKKINIDGVHYYYINGLDARIAFPDIILLGKFDPLLLAYSDKSWIIDHEKEKYIWKKAGQVEGVIMLDGDVVGTWKCRKFKDKLFFFVSQIQQISSRKRELIEYNFSKIANSLNLNYQGSEII